ncbi:murein biosynthesis integral membrane protein MurJ [Fluoribacter dumoffii]|uniref:murein biosynthesis integral membrane protein MurJ n=1 Tax=Fluoribacter dumoffii TaxID=463 RepID=UPI0022443572|nr:murein biosynthesis integral membrane protein MurJ [Fluoribacter dumoffii]MCW8418192.1 murein biosynthesis integral membrane protein MurJ [Fluoribacter dumoffii]MCW8453966.1 murein biosynthesis integral membrane protein MurJ [Fluoribacter dumoffii]MCW8461963.1 murein biosynthesis integral membrane protein MurJ [Fluoribacter dumoffii]MCW8482175.1 murein biosynthesis integral membrane protein MurJ [Fluoribacter dumoffii]
MSGDKKLNIKATGIIALAVMCSRVLGLIREVLFNALFGSASMGIFLIAFRAPNLLRDLFAEGALSISFVTVFSKKMETEGEHSAWELAAKMLTLTSIFMSILCLLGIVFAKYIIFILAPGFSAKDAETTVFLTQLMFPFILLVSLAAIVMGMLNSKNVFGMPALASSFFNVGSILGGALCGWFIDPTFGEKALIGLAIGTVIGGLLQLGVQLPSLRKVGFHFKPNFQWFDSGVRNTLILTIPAVIAASAVQINVLINSGFASYLGKEAVTWLNSAFRLMQFPLGVLGVAIATITLPVVSRLAATNNHSQFGYTLARALRLSVFLTMPAAVGLWFFAHPIINFIYEHGKFHAADSLQTAYALQYYALGLVAYSSIKVLSPAFYAIDKKWTPMIVSFATIILNIFSNYFLIFKLNMGHCGLALSTTISATVNFLILYVIMARLHNLQNMYFFSTVFRCALASATLGLVCQCISIYGTNFLYHPSFWIRGFSLLISISCAVLTYLIMCGLLKLEEVKGILMMIRQRLVLSGLKSKQI